jgi:hypothetical protein
MADFLIIVFPGYVWWAGSARAGSAAVIDAAAFIL